MNILHNFRISNMVAREQIGFLPITGWGDITAHNNKASKMAPFMDNIFAVLQCANLSYGDRLK